ncbi:MAG: sulfonate transport system permease protein [Candidatus Aldehydirespiratoraceae bacterium]|jgi:sulfonate transport system permease protein
MAAADPTNTDDQIVLRRTSSDAERNPGASARRRKLIETGLAIAGPIVFLALWEVCVRNDWWLDGRLISSPWEIVTSSKLREAEVWEAVWITTVRMLKGFIIGTGLGIVLGVAMGTNRYVRAALNSTLTALYTVPKIALLPVYLLIFGFEEAPRVYMIATVVFFFVWIYTMAPIMAVPVGYREAAASFNATRWQMFKHVLWPAALPQIFVGLRVSAGVAVLMVIAVELILPRDGIGYFVNRGRELGLPDNTFLGVLLAALLGIVFVGLVRWIGRVLTPWAPEDNSPGQI